MLRIAPGMVVVDGTLGLGGHAEGLLGCMDSAGLYVGIDRDAEAIRRSALRLDAWTGMCRFVQGNFADMEALAAQAGVREADAVLMDLGMSSMQLDCPERGFAFLQDGPLDMRMDTSSGMTAADWLEAAEETELVTVFRQYGEEPQARRVARAIVQERASQPIRTTHELAEIVSRAKGGRRGPRHPATQVFQAIRMRINEEMENLRAGLTAGLSLLRDGGRMAVIAFHSVEDREVKQFAQRHTARWESLPEGGQVRRGEPPLIRRVNRRVIRPSQDECTDNPRARSARLRVMEKGGD